MRILIDARLYGLENAGLGRYIINLVKELSIIDAKNEYVIFLRKKYFNELNLPQNWQKVLTDFHHYTFEEQIKLPFLISKFKPKITHFPHINVPILYSGNYIVTIHDTLMHNFKGLSATTRFAPIYFIKQFAYKLAFYFAVYRSKSIIVPSNTIKNELLSYYNIDEKKINVIYE